MKLSYKLKGMIVAALMAGFVSFSDAAFAQEVKIPQVAKQQATTDFSEEELKQFIDANARLMVVQEESEKLMLQVLMEEKLDIEKFNELALAYQQQKMDEAKATPEERAAFNRIAQRLMELQPVVQKGVKDAIEKDGMTLDTYEKIMMAYQESPMVQAKVQSMIAVAEE